MKTREEALQYGLTFEDAYVDTPFKDTNWQLVWQHVISFLYYTRTKN